LWQYTRRVARIAIFFLLFLAICLVGEKLSAYLLKSGDVARGSLVLGGTFLFVLLLLGLAYLVSLRTFLASAVRFGRPTLSFRKANMISACAMHHRYGTVIKLHLCFLPMFIFSILLFGLPFFFVFPQYLATKSALSLGILSKKIEDGGEQEAITE
jgi:Ca2+/Na+ antiporter